MSNLIKHENTEINAAIADGTTGHPHMWVRSPKGLLVVFIIVVIFMAGYATIGSDAAYRRGQLGLGDKIAMRLPEGKIVTQTKYAAVVKSLVSAGYAEKSGGAATTARDKASELFALNAFLIENAKQTKTVVSAELLQKSYVKTANTTLSADEYKKKLNKSGVSDDYLRIISENDAYQQTLGPKLIKQKSVTIIEAPWRVLEGVLLDKLTAVQSELMSDFDQNYRQLLIGKKPYEAIQSAATGKSLKSKSANLIKPSIVVVSKSSPYPSGRPNQLYSTNFAGPSKNSSALEAKDTLGIILPVKEGPIVERLSVGQVSSVIKSESGNFVAVRLDALSTNQPYDSWQTVSTLALKKTKTY